MDKNRRLIETENAYEQAFIEFQETRLYKELKKKFSVKPYYRSHMGIKWLVLLASFVFNILSAITASVAAYFIALGFCHQPDVAVALTVVFLVLLEFIKRFLGTLIVWHNFQFRKYSFVAIVVFIVLVSISVSLSYSGSKKVVYHFATAPVLVNVDSMTASQKQEIANIDEQIEKARQTTYRGTTTRKSQETIILLTDQRKSIQENILAIEQEVKAENKKTMAVFEQENGFSSSLFALFTLACEVCFLFCLFYLGYYGYRSLGEFEKEMKFSEERKAAFLEILKDYIDEEFERLVEAKLAAAQIKSQQPEAEVKDVKLSLQNLEPESQDAESELQKSQGELQETEPELQKAEDESQEVELGLQKSQEELQEAESELQKAEDESQEVESELQKAQGELQGTESELQQLQGESQDGESELQKAEDESQEVESELQIPQEGFQQAESELQQSGLSVQEAKVYGGIPVTGEEGLAEMEDEAASPEMDNPAVGNTVSRLSLVKNPVEYRENQEGISAGDASGKGDADHGNDDEIEETVEVQKTRIQELEKAIKKVRNKITTAKYRIQRKIGRTETSERNLKVCEKELKQLLQELKFRKDKLENC